MRTHTVLPQISVIVPIYRDWERLNGLAEGIMAQCFFNFELILVDNAPHDDPVDPARDAVLERLQASVPAQLILCTQPGSYAARNAGAQAAQGQALVFTDADCVPAEGWLQALADALDAKPNALLAGPVTLCPSPAPNSYEVFDTVRGMPQESFIRHGYAVTANLALQKALFDRLGGFDPARFSGGDAEFCRRAGRQGIRLYLVKDAIIYHPARDSWDAIATKARRIKGGQVASGPKVRRLIWTLRSFSPPMREIITYLVSSHPFKWRIRACWVRLRLWGVELHELVRLLVFRSARERR